MARAALLVGLGLAVGLAPRALGYLRGHPPVEMSEMQGRERPDDHPLLTARDIDPLDRRYPETFTLADYHIALIRQAVISWDPAESGAPAIDPEKPFGSVSTRAAIARAARLGSSSDTGRLKAIYAEIGYALQSFLWYGKLEPGVYRVPHPLNGEVARLDRPFVDKDSRQPQVIELRFTDAHRRLLERAVLRWTDWPGWFGDRHLNPTPGIDPKRPYGDMTYFELDMAEILGIPVKDPPSDPLTKQQEQDLWTLHDEMKRALQVFVVRAQTQPGVYKSKY